jgi:hypothetical protein
MTQALVQIVDVRRGNLDLEGVDPGVVRHTCSLTPHAERLLPHLLAHFAVC